jgi:4-hydroxythreonine-4-phosphate dehydrogenase
MIYITQGHENSISLEIFFKSIACLPTTVTRHLRLVADPEVIKKNIDLLGGRYSFLNSYFEFQIKKTKRQIHFLSIQKSSPIKKLSTLALEMALNTMDQTRDILLTLPTSKDQLLIKGKRALGYTEYLRLYTRRPELAMNFVAPDLKMLLVTDHIPLSQVKKQLTSKLILKKVSLSLAGHKKYFTPIKEVLLAGINPHAGEGGLLGNEDRSVVKAIRSLRKRHPKIRFIGPVPGDSLAFHWKMAKDQLFVCMYHDQGLAWFKSQQRLLGLNVTLGLPFLRMSVDHGTAFEMYGKNKANPEGMLYLLKTALKIHRTIC